MWDDARHIRDPLGQPVASAQIAGQALDVGPNGEFDAMVPSRWGMNILQVDVVDGAGLPFQASQTVIAAERFAKGPGHTIFEMSAATLDLLGRQLSEFWPKWLIVWIVLHKTITISM